MKFERNNPVETEEPMVDVDGFDRAGEYRFQLVVEDKNGQRSAPAVWVVTVDSTP